MINNSTLPVKLNLIMGSSKKQLLNLEYLQMNHLYHSESIFLSFPAKINQKPSKKLEQKLAKVDSDDYFPEKNLGE